MSGAYAHITLVHFEDRARLSAMEDFPSRAIGALLRNLKYCELGAVSPDYPYLALGNANARKWADLMHWQSTGQVIRAGAKRVRQMTGRTAEKCLAWLLGYTAHVATDVTIHPVIALKVGGVTGHDQEHRICEMHQDVYAFQKLGVGPVGLSDFLRGGIGACGSSTRAGALDEDIRTLWTAMLQDVHGVEHRQNPPDPDLWHGEFQRILKLANGRHLVPFARHVGVDMGLFYPQPSELDPQYLKDLPIPNGGRADFDELFTRILENIGRTWKSVAEAVIEGKDDELAWVGGWNLDTGRDDYDQSVFWGIA
jgi:hypothetical protein